LKQTDTREKIIEQALIYFSKNDYDRASLNDIAGALNITKGAIYHYFGSKDELFKETVVFFMRRLFSSYGDMFGAAEDLETKEMLSLWFSLGQMVDEAQDQTGVDMKDYANLVYLMFSALKKFPEVGQLMGKMYSTTIIGMGKFLKKAQEKGEIRSDLDPEALAFELTAFTEGAMLMGSVIKDLDLERYGRRSFENFWKRVRAD